MQASSYDKKSPRRARMLGVGACFALTLGLGIWGNAPKYLFPSDNGTANAAPTPPTTPLKAPVEGTSGTFVNPFRAEWGADPWIVYRDGYYYFTATSGNEVQIAKARTLTGLGSAQPVVVWRRPETGPNSRDIWAPEVHYLRGKWYVYYTGSNGTDPGRRVFALEALTDNPQGAYRDCGQMRVPNSDEYSIDASVFEKANGKMYMIWSGREQSANGPQRIYIAPMSDPLTISGPRVALSTPTYDWEKHGWEVNEGPELLEHGDKTFVVYSGSGGTTPYYCLGLLTNTDGDLLNAASWMKSARPVFSQYQGPGGAVYTPGHNGFFKSPDGKQDWIVYHGKENTDGTWGGRTARAQQFTWNPDDTPNFGFPIPADIPLAVPAGEAGAPRAAAPGNGTGLHAEYFNDGDDKKPDFKSAPIVTREGENVDFDWNLNAPAPGVNTDYFAARWRGQIQPRYSQMYSFQTFADDGVRVKIDDDTVINNWTNQVATGQRGFKYLEAGHKYNIEVEYYDADQGARCSLYWASKSQPFEPVPRTCFFPPVAAG